MKKRTLSALVCLLCMALSFSGCYYYGAGTENLLVPPKLTAKQEEIYQALVEQVGSNINLRYPKTGEYRSAFVIKDIDEEPTTEAIVFYQNATNATPPGALRLSILDQQEDRWVSTYEAAGEGNDVHQVDFSDFGTTDGSLFVVIGYSMTSESDNVLHIYRYQDGKITDLFSQPYSLMQVVDIDNDGCQEIVTVTKMAGQNAQLNTTRANVIKYQNGVFQIIDSVDMDAGVTSYVNVKVGFVGNNVSALYLDGLKGKDKMTTQLLFYQEGRLQNNAQFEKEYNDNMTRQSGTLSMDIDQDGIIEIPVLQLMPGYTEPDVTDSGTTLEAGTADSLYFTHWKVFRDGAFEEKMVSYLNVSYGFSFKIPEYLQGKITARRFKDRNEIVFYRFNGSLEDSQEELFRIRVVNRQKEVEEENEKYETITTSGQLTYLAAIPEQDNSGLWVSMPMIRQNFSLIK